MMLTDYFPNLKDKIPYINQFEDLFCIFEEREEVKCTDEFYKKGFFKDLVWDKAAEYQYKCNACPYFKHDIGFYFGNDNYSDSFEEKTAFCLNVKTSAELSNVVRYMPNARKVFFLNHGKNFDFSPIETLHDIECVQVYLGTHDILWNMNKTPNIRVLEINMGASPPSLEPLAMASCVEYLSLTVLISQINNTVLPSFDFFAGMKNLKGLVLSGTTNASRSIDALIALPHLERLWVSPNLFSTEEYAKFEAKRFKVYDEYGIFENDDFGCPLGIGKRQFRSEQSKQKFSSEYKMLMSKYT